MRIGIDGYNLAMPHGTGVATYGFVLAETLRSAGHQIEGVFGLDVGKNVSMREVMFYDRLNGDAERQKTRAEAKAETRTLRRATISPFALPARDVPTTEWVVKRAFAARLPQFDRIVTAAKLFEAAHRHFAFYGRFLKLSIDTPPDVMHWTYPVPIRLEGARNVYTLHDLVPLRLPYTTLDAKRMYRRILARCVRDGDAICTVSESSRADIVGYFDVDPSRVVNTYQASPLPPHMLDRSAEEDAAAIEGIFGLRQDGYFLFFGAIEPKKNLGRLIEAYLAAQIDTPLVIVGARAWQSDAELRLLPKKDGPANAFSRSIGRRVIRLDYLPRALLLRLVRGARAALFPSLYEGFGLPVLEAMQLGTPVLTSQTSSLPEVAGDAAVYVDPYNTASIAAGLVRLDGDAGLRAELGRRGMEQAARFSQATYRDRLAPLYAQACRGGPAAP